MDAVPDSIYTQEQIDYVNSVKDEHLRDHLLHTVRLRDNLKQDRDAFEKQAGEWPSLQKAVERLRTELGKDKSNGSYYYTWQCNIAMAFKDAYYKDPAAEEMKDIRHIANEAAKNFLDLLIK